MRKSRFEIVCDSCRNKNLVEIEALMNTNSFLSGSEKRILKLLIRNNVDTANYLELKQAGEMGNYFISNGCDDPEYIQNRIKKIKKRLEDIDN